MSECPTCEQLPPPIRRDGTIYLALPHEPGGRHVVQYLTQAGHVWSEPHDGILAVSVTPASLESLCTDCFSVLSDLEQADTRCVILPDGQAPTILELAQMQSLKSLVAQIQGAWLLDLLREERLVAFFQPIVSCAQPTEVYAYECLMRGRAREGGFIPAGRLFQHARDASVLFQLDRAARLAAIRDAQHHEIATNLFINFNPTALYDPQFCLRTTVASIKKAGIDPSRVIFEVVESEEIKDKNHLLGILQYYRDNGFRVALDDLGAGYSSLNLLHHLRPDFIKLDMDLIRHCDTDPYKAHIASNLLNLARELGIETIAEGVETAGEWAWLREQRADYVQGFLFAAPGETPPIPSVPSAL